MKSTKGELASGSDHLKNAKRLLEKLERRKWIDKIIFIACLAFFFATCVYILLKEQFDTQTEMTLPGGYFHRYCE